MSFDSPNHHTKHHQVKHLQSWDTSNDYQFYATTMEPEATKRPDAPPYRHAYTSFNTDYEESVFEAPRRAQVIEYYERAPVVVKCDSYEVGDVDAEAEGFIKLEHRKFELSKWKSVNSGRLTSSCLLYERAPVLVKSDGYEVGDDVDEESEGFIQLERKKFGLSK